MDMFIILAVVIISQMHICVKTYQIIHFKYVITYMSIMSQWSQNKKKFTWENVGLRGGLKLWAFS